MTSGKSKTDFSDSVKTSDTGGASQWSGNRIILCLILFNILSGTASGILQMALPIYAMHLHAGTSEIGLLRSVSGFGMLLAVLPAGYWTDRFGWKRVFGLGTILSAGTVLLLPLSGNIHLLIGFMGLQGAANSIRLSSLSAAFLQHLNKIGLSKAGWYKGSISIGLTFAGPLLGGVLLEVLDYSTLFWLTGILMLLPLWYAMIGPDEEKRPDRSSGGANGILQVCSRTLSGYLNLVKHPLVRRTVLFESLSTGCFATFAAFVAVFLSRAHGIPAARASWFLIAEGSIFILTVFLGGKAVERYGFTRSYIVGFILSSVGLLLFGLSSHAWGLFAGTAIMGVGLGLVNLITYSQAATLPVGKGQLSSLLSFCTGIGAAWGPAVAGGAGELWGLQTVFIGYIPLFFLAVIVLLIHGRVLSLGAPSARSLEEEPKPVGG